MSIYKKLFEAKKEIGKLTKDAKNPFFKSSYLSINALLEAVESVLSKHELLLLQPIKDGKVTTVIHDATKDGTTDNTFVYSEMDLPSITDPQKLGSAITYFRRYTLESLLGLRADDDDGNKASKPIDYTRQFTMLRACKDLDELKDKFLQLTSTEQVACEKVKDEMKVKLSK